MSEPRPDRRVLVEEVDALLQSVRADVAQLEQEREAAVERAAAAEQALERRDADEATRSGHRVADVQRAIEGALGEARRAAEEILAEARARADRLLADAEAEVRQMAADGAPDVAAGRAADASDGNLFADLRRSVARGDHLVESGPTASTDDAASDAQVAPAPSDRSWRRRPVPARVMSLASLLARR